MTRKDFLIENEKNKDWKKTLRPQKDGKEILKPYPLMTMREKYMYNNIYKIGYLDIETSGLTANFDFMVSWCMYVRDVRTGKTELRGDKINPKDFEVARKGTKKDGKWTPDADLVDKRILESLLKAISDIDCLIGHWFIGKHRHDIPFVRSRIAINKISGFPKHKMVRYGDTQKLGSLIHRLSSNGLAMIGDAYGVSTKKTQIKSKHWKNACMFGNKESVDYIYHHNIKDVILTYKIHKCMEEYVPIPAIYA